MYSSGNPLDLNSTEHAWDLLDNHLPARDLSPVTIPLLQLALQETWYSMSKHPIDNLVLNMTDVVTFVLQSEWLTISTVKDLIVPTKCLSDELFRFLCSCIPSYLFKTVFVSFVFFVLMVLISLPIL